MEWRILRLTRPSLQDATLDRVGAASPCCDPHNQDVQPDSLANSPNARPTTSAAHPFDSPDSLDLYPSYGDANAASESAGSQALNNISDWDTALVGEMILHNPNNISFPCHLPKILEREMKLSENQIRNVYGRVK
jgi:hypothetical protein